MWLALLLFPLVVDEGTEAKNGSATPQVPTAGQWKTPGLSPELGIQAQGCLLYAL